MSSSYAYPHQSAHPNGYTANDARPTDNLKDKIGGFLGKTSGGELPLYKDKPQYASKGRGMLHRLHIRKGRKRWIFGALGLFSFWWTATSLMGWLNKAEVNWATRQNMVRTAFITSWEDYAKHAWGKDVYSPISHESKFIVSHNYDGTSTNAGIGWLIIDGLDTAMIMNCTHQVAQARKWIQTSLDFNKLDGYVNVFETTIRVLGGLLSAHYLSTTFPHLAPQMDDDHGQKGEDLYIEKAVDLAERLLGAFETPTGIPLPSVNLNNTRGLESGEGFGTSSTAEVATLQLELKYVAKLTGEPLYWTLAERVIQILDEPRMEGGLLPIAIDPGTGSFQGNNIRLGSRGDSYYEYLVKQYLQTGETIYKEMWDEALEGIKRHLITWSKGSNFTVLVERPAGLDGPWSGKMDHLTCFLPGTIVLGLTGGLTVAEAKKAMGNAWGRQQEEDLVLAEELMKTCWAMYVRTPTGLAGEITYLEIDYPPRRWNFRDTLWKQPRSIVTFEDENSKAYGKSAAWQADLDIRSNDVHNLQRPETVESLYILYRITGKTMYRDWGWKMFRSFQKWSQVVDSGGKLTGYTSLESVMRLPPKHLDSLILGSKASHYPGSQGHENTVKRDNMEGFWLAETLKYFYLLFSNDISDDWFDLRKIVINTEAHIFPRFDITGHAVFKTGWTRKTRSSWPSHHDEND